MANLRPGSWPVVFTEGTGWKIVIWRAPPLSAGDVIDMSTAFFSPFSATLLSGGSNQSSTMSIRGPIVTVTAGGDGFVMVVGTGA